MLQHIAVSCQLQLYKYFQNDSKSLDATEEFIAFLKESLVSFQNCKRHSRAIQSCKADLVVSQPHHSLM